MTSEACKTLYNGNVALQSKHQALLARLPAGQTMTPSSSNTPISSAAPSPHWYTSSLPRDRTPSTVSVEPPHHFRRISVSPSDIAQLADQNAELMQTLQELEAESSHADQAGKRKLKRLEEEIQTLRAELEAAQSRSVELEQQVSVGTKVEKGSEEAEKRRLEREERLRGLKGKVGLDGEDDEDPTPRDFAPSNPLGLSTSSRSSGSSTAKSSQSPPTTPSQAAPSLITRLVNKIAELEQMNDQMNEQHRETEARLRQAEMDAENIRKLYSFLDDDPQVEVQVVDDEDTPSEPSTASQDHSVRFRSLRRSLHFDSARLSLDSRFDNGIKNVMQSTLRSTSNRLHLANVPHRNRKSVVGFFGSASPLSTGLPSETGSPAFVFPRSPLQVETASYAPTEPSEFGASSPALSTLDLPANNFGRGHTLGSELGSQYGDDWVANAENHHLRTSSLYGLSQMTDTNPSPLLSPSSPGAEHSPFLPISPAIAIQTATPPHHQPQDYLSQPTDAHLQLTPTPGKTDLPDADADVDETPKSFGRSNAIERNRRLSQTVRSRTTHWVDRRFKDTLKSLGENVESGDEPSSTSLDFVLSPSTPFVSPPDEVRSPVVGVHSTAEAISAATGVVAPAAFTKVLDAMDAMVDQFVGVASSSTGKSNGPQPPSVVEKEAPSSEIPGSNRGIRTRKPSTAAVQSQAKKQGLAAVMLEVWLWLQFVIIIVVFLWAMAKRGPKGVLRDAERRRTMSGVSRR